MEILLFIVIAFVIMKFITAESNNCATGRSSPSFYANKASYSIFKNDHHQGFRIDDIMNDNMMHNASQNYLDPSSYSNNERINTIHQNNSGPKFYSSREEAISQGAMYKVDGGDEGPGYYV